MKTSEARLFIFLLISVIGSQCQYLESMRDTYNGEPEAETDLSQVHFLFWSRSHVEDFGYYELIYGDEVNLQQSGFDGSLNTYMLFHGYTDAGTKQWILNTKTEHLLQKPCNVISIDYAALVPSPNYPAAVANMYNVSAHTADFIDWLVISGGASSSRFHLTGHSLGAHAAGMTAQYVQTGLIDRVTGLDPAGPLFYNETNSRRLFKTQAHFVDVIHSNGCSVAKGCSGIVESLGHADFFPNGGSYQAGCTPITEASTGCSHQRVTALWTESITAGVGPSNELTFTSWPCSSWEEFEAGNCTTCGINCLDMGFNVQREYVEIENGDQYLYTNDVAPYALGPTQEP